jgi:hypothetical protein
MLLIVVDTNRQFDGKVVNVHESGTFVALYPGPAAYHVYVYGGTPPFALAVSVSLWPCWSVVGFDGVTVTVRSSNGYELAYSVTLFSGIMKWTIVCGVPISVGLPPPV